MNLNEINPNVENTDVEPHRVYRALKSMTSFYQNETIRLDAEKRLLGEEIHLSRDPHKKAELRHALVANGTERDRLDSGYVASSLRKHIVDVQQSPSTKANVKSGSIAGIEKRFIPPSGGRGMYLKVLPVEVEQEERSSGDKVRKTIYGYAAVFDKPSVDIGYIEYLERGCFTSALKTSDVRCLFNHSAHYVLGRSKAKTLRTYQDEIGLKFFCDLIPGDPVCEGVAARISRGDISGCSFSFTTKKDRWVFTPGEPDKRYIVEVLALYDVSPVTYPAYPDTSCGIETKESKMAPGGYMTEAELQQAESEEDVNFERDRAWDIRKKYNHAGRILNRCRASVVEEKAKANRILLYGN